MDSLDLDIIHGIERNVVSSLIFNPLLQLHLVLSLDFDEVGHEVGVVSVRHELLQVVERGDPLVDATESIADQLGETWIAAMNPSSGSNSVRLVLEFSWIELMELLEDGLLEELRMECGDTVNGMRAHDTEICHPDLFGVALLDERQPCDFAGISWVLLLQFCQVNVVDQIDELHVSWQKILHKIDIPFLEGLWQHGMICVGERVVNDLPGTLERQLFLVNEDTEKLDGGDGWMRII